jgi:dihydroxyacetone kinase
MGVAMTPCVIPSLGKSTFELAADEMEIGLGIHGEHGLEKAKMKPADDIVRDIIDKIMKFSSVGRQSQSCVVLVNNLGSATVMEISIIARAVLLYFGKQHSKVSIERCYVGQYLTAMEMSGFSISVAPANPDILAWCVSFFRSLAK